MIEKFERLEQEKKSKILNAAFLEFTKNGYKNASTNVIAKEAGIGKGTLFYYFDNKEKLFSYLYDYALERIYSEYLDKVDYSEQDLFNRVIQLSELKRAAFEKYGVAFSFLIEVFLNLDQEDYQFFKEEATEERKKTTAIQQDMFRKNVDFSRIREDIDSEKALNLTVWGLEGMLRDMEARFKFEDMSALSDSVMKKYYDEFFEYLNIMKKLYYKPEYVEEIKIGGKK